ALQMQRAQIERARVTTGDSFSDYTAQFSDRTAEWMHRNRDWITDPKKSARVQSAHFSAVADGLSPDSDEYFSHVEKAIGLRSGGGNGSSRGGNMQRGSMKYDPADHRTHVTPNGVYLTENERKIAQDGTLV